MRQTFSIVMGCMLALALTASAALVVISTLLHTSAQQLGAAVESVRLVEDLQVALLVHSRVRPRDPGVTHDSARTLRNQLSALRGFSAGPADDALIDDVEARVEHYLRQPDAGGLDRASSLALAEAEERLQSLVRLNVQQARDVGRDARRWDDVANGLGVSTAALLLLGMVAILLWLNSAVLRPVSQIGEAAERFGTGDHGARADEAGPTELREMARRFNGMAAALGRQREDQLTFLAGVAHDLRNPLAALKLTAGMVRPGRPLPPEESLRETMAVVLDQTGRLERMVGDLLDAARIEAGHLEIMPRPMDLRAAARAAVDLYAPTSALHTLTLDAPDAPVCAVADPLRIEQVLNNLVSNAVKYSPGGGQVRVTVSETDGYACVEVRDDGLGISREDQRRLFEPFRRGSGTSEQVPGVGLGLSVARRIVLAHGGSMEVESELGRGSIFRVRVPLAPPAARALVRERG